jgi:gliding motility-associated-like protein
VKRSLVIFFLFLSGFAFSTHNRSGEITYKRIVPFTEYRYLITVTIYTDDDTPLSSQSPQNNIVDRCVDTVYFGDGAFAAVQRINGGATICAGCQPCNCDHCGVLIFNENGYRVKKNIYQVEHVYPGAGSFTIRTTDPNRNEGVHNMFNSGQQAFYLESVLEINTFSGSNNSPVFKSDPVDRACVGKCFTHSAAAYDSDGDSISYKISAPKGEDGQTVLGYFDPEVPPGGSFNIHPTSGILTWCAPTLLGEYNIAFVVEEWRRNTNGHRKIVGTVLRDLQIVVRSCPNNDPPLVTLPVDTCVEAGTFFTKKILVSDPNPSSTVTVVGLGGAFSAPEPTANLTHTTSVLNGNILIAEFSWQTTCAHVREQPYLTTFKASDSGPGEPLVSFKTYNIWVIPSPVKDVSALPIGSTIKISWSLSTCDPSNNPIVSYKIYRKENCDPFIPAYCQQGVLSSNGFTYVGKTDNATTNFFIDSNKGEGLVVGQNYSYVVVAVYRDGVQSYAGSQVCTKLKRDVPVLLNVDVSSTDAVKGTVFIRWAAPLTSHGNFDSILFPGPYLFNLKHRENPRDLFTTIYTSTNNFVSQLDLSYTHSGINTSFKQHEYQIEFIAGTYTIGSTQKASSVSLSGTPSDRKIDLTWIQKTPWKNYRYTVFRKSYSSTNFTQIATTTLTSFSDINSVVNKNVYSYYILTEGAYSDETITKPLLNKSEIISVTAVDLTPPCSPTLNIESDCPSGFVRVSWENVRPICSDDVIKYLLYYKNTVDENYEKIYETDTTYYLYDGLTMVAGCYAIQSQDSSNNLSNMSSDFCVDICPEFELPDVFSPNGDDANDHFMAIKVRQIKAIDLAIVDRWGHLVYQTKDPYFKWNGISSVSKQAVSEGTFFYVCTVYEPRVKGIVKRVLKGHVQVVR